MSELEPKKLMSLGPINVDGDQCQAFLEIFEQMDFGEDDPKIRYLELVVIGNPVTARLELFEDGIERLITLLSEGLEHLREGGDG